MEEAKRERDRAAELFKKDFVSKSSLNQAASVYDSSVAAERASAAKVSAAAACRNAATSQVRRQPADLGSRPCGKGGRGRPGFQQIKARRYNHFLPGFGHCGL